MGDDDAYVFRYEEDKLVSSQVNYPSEVSRQQLLQAKAKKEGEREKKGISGDRDATVVHSVLPMDRDDVSQLLKHMQKSRLLRLVILSHQLDTSTPASISQSNNKSTTHMGTETAPTATKVEATATDQSDEGKGKRVCAVEQLIPEEEVMRRFRDADPVLMKSNFKYLDGSASMWKSDRLGK